MPAGRAGITNTSDSGGGGGGAGGVSDDSPAATGGAGSGLGGAVFTNGGVVNLTAPVFTGNTATQQNDIFNNTGVVNIVAGAPAATIPVPTTTTWGLMLLGLLLVVVAAFTPAVRKD